MNIVGTKMVSDGKTARQLFDEVMANPARAKFGFGDKLAIVNVDFQNAYTRIDEFKTAYETDPRQIEYVNTISRLARAKGMPVVWTHVAYAEDASDAGVWGTRTNTPDSLQNIKYGSRRHAFDDRQGRLRNRGGPAVAAASGRVPAATARRILAGLPRSDPTR